MRDLEMGQHDLELDPVVINRVLQVGHGIDVVLEDSNQLSGGSHQVASCY